jgi:hypothetical protein
MSLGCHGESRTQSTGIIDAGPLGELSPDLVLHHAGQQAGGRRQGHGDDGCAFLGPDLTDEAEAGNADAEVRGR